MTRASSRRDECWRGRRPRRSIAALVAAVCAWALSGNLWAQAPRDSDVEAAYLFNFAKFMHAPAHSPDTFTIAVVGKSPITEMLETIAANEHIGDRALKVLNTASAEQARNCDMVFLGDSESPRMDRDLTALAGSNALVVSDIPDFVQRGGMIQFEVVNQRVRFLVNLDAVKKEKISLSSELLKVALSVSGTTAKEAQP